MKTPILETKRLILRPVTMSDAPAIQKYFNNWNIVQYLSMAVPWPYPDDGSETFIRDICLPEMESGKSFVWSITVKSLGDEAVGLISFHPDGDRNGSGTNRGFWLAEHLHGHGYMTETVNAVTDFVFDKLKLDHFHVGNVVTNQGSRRVKQKTGAEFIGIVQLPHHNGISESEKWIVTRENWEQLRQKK